MDKISRLEFSRATFARSAFDRLLPSISMEQWQSMYDDVTRAMGHLNNCHEWQIWKYRLFAPLEWDTVAVMDDKIYLRQVDRAIQLMAQEYIDPFAA